MMIKIILLCASITLFPFQGSQAAITNAAIDVTDNYGNAILVTRIADMVSFQEKLSNGNSRYLGRKQHYLMQELINQKIWEYAEGGTSSIVAGVLVVGLGWCGLALGAIESGALYTGGEITFAVVGKAAIGAGIGAGVSYVLHANPYEQFSQARTLNQDVLDDLPVSVSDVEDFADRLDLVLRKID